jgi:hypothetical protein
VDRVTRRTAMVRGVPVAVLELLTLYLVVSGAICSSPSAARPIRRVRYEISVPVLHEEESDFEVLQFVSAAILWISSSCAGVHSISGSSTKLKR